MKYFYIKHIREQETNNINLEILDKHQSTKSK